MKRTICLIFMYIWPLLEYWVYLALSIGTCYFKFRVTDFAYPLHFITVILIEATVLVLFGKGGWVKVLVLLHFIVFVVWFGLVFGNYFADLPLPCFVNSYRRLE